MVLSNSSAKEDFAFRLKKLRSEKSSFHSLFLFVCTLRHGGHVGGQEQKRISPVGTKCKFFEQNFYCIDPQHGRLVPWLQTKNRPFL